MQSAHSPTPQRTRTTQKNKPDPKGGLPLRKTYRLGTIRWTPLDRQHNVRLEETADSGVFQ